MRPAEAVWIHPHTPLTLSQGGGCALVLLQSLLVGPKLIKSSQELCSLLILLCGASAVGCLLANEAEWGLRCPASSLLPNEICNHRK